MTAKYKLLVLRVLFAPVSALLAMNLFEVLSGPANNIVHAVTKSFGLPFYLYFNARMNVVFGFFLCWMFLQIILEIRAAYGSDFRFPRLLTNLRAAPFLILLFSTVVVIFYDLGKIEYTKRQITQYVYSDSASVAAPEFVLYNNYRGWPAYGYPEHENYLYFETAAEGFHDQRAAVRVRALLMSARVQNWYNGGDQRFEEMLAESCADSDKLLNDTAENLLYRRNTSCQKLLSSR